MAEEKHGTDPILAAIEAKIAAWSAVADSYRAAMSIDGPLGEGSVLTMAKGVGKAHLASRMASELPVGIFRNKSIKEAIVLYLDALQRKQTNKEIAIGLQKGGIATTSKTFEATISTALHRLKADGVVLRFADGWDLAAHYPDNLRNRLEKDRKPQKKDGATRTARKRRQPAAKHEHVKAQPLSLAAAV